MAAVILAGCKMKTYNPIITDFDQRATVTAGDFSYECNIARGQGTVTVAALSTNARGAVITYNGKSAVFSYLGMDYEIESAEIDSTNPAKAIYEAFEAVCSQPENVSRTKDGFRYDGKTALGEFTLLQNDDDSYKSLFFKDADIKIIFK